MIDTGLFLAVNYCCYYFSTTTISCLCLKVLDSNPLPGMVITPSEGVVPVGGRADLKISFTPNAKMNFDTRVEVFKSERLYVEMYVHLIISEAFLWCSNPWREEGGNFSQLMPFKLFRAVLRSITEVSKQPLT